MGRKKTELLAPAGSLASVIAAVNAGADAVYMGGPKFGARAYAESAGDGGEDMVLKAIEYCHLFGVQLHMTVNILFKDAELKELFSYMKPYYEAGVDALIVQDLGAVRILQDMFPDLPIHSSTQMCVSGPESARMVQKLGMKRAVLARELGLQEIKRIHDEVGIELETFIHGAMCYSYSGECFMSSLLGGRSGNRGRCAGTCRLCYETAGKKGYYLSMKDMNTVEFLPELIEAGAYSMKIEGRMKSPIYTAGVVSVYRKYLDLAMEDPDHFKVDEKDLTVLREIYDRGGMDNYLKKHNGKEMIAISEKGFRVVNESITKEIEDKYIKSNKRIPVDMGMYIREGEKMILHVSATKEEGRIISVNTVSKEMIGKADKSGTPRENIEKQMRKTGNTVFTVEHVFIDMLENENVFIPISSLNELRRSALDQLKEALLESTRRKSREIE